MALGPLHIAQEPLQDLVGALNGLRVFFWNVLCNMLENLKVAQPTYGFGRWCFHEVPEWKGILLTFPRRHLVCAP